MLVPRISTPSMLRSDSSATPKSMATLESQPSAQDYDFVMQPLSQMHVVDMPASEPEPRETCWTSCMHAPRNFARHLKAMTIQDYIDTLVTVAQTVIDLANGPLGQLIVKLLAGGLV